MTIGGKVSKVILDVTGRIGMILGFSTFYYHKQRKSFINSKLLHVYSKAMAFVFFVLYPMGIYKSFYEEHPIPESVTDYARYLLTIITYLLTFLIYLNQTSNSTVICEIYNRALKLYRCYDDMNGVTNLDGPMGKCAIRVFILTGGFVGINFMKFTRDREWTTLFENLLFIYLFIPNFTISLVSNRFYTAATYFTHLLSVGNEILENLGAEVARDAAGVRQIEDLRYLSTSFVVNGVENLSQNYSALHKLFKDFHQIYAKFVIFILGFCIYNTIFELYFLYLNLSISMRYDIHVNTTFICYCCTQTLLFMYEFISLIFVYNKLKVVSEECSSILHRISILSSSREAINVASNEIMREIETFSIRLMHDKFEANVCGLFVIDNALLFSIISSITIHLILIIQFQIDEARKQPNNDVDKWLILLLNGGMVNNETED